MGFKKLFKNRSFLFLFIGQVVSQFGDRINQMALIGLVNRSTTQLAKIFSFTILPVFLVGPLAGVYVDRWNRKYTMFFSDVLRGILVFILAAYLLNYKSFIPIYVIVFLVFCVSRFFIPAKMSIVPEIVEPSQINLANSLTSITGMVAAILGFGVGGYLVERLGTKNAFILDSLTFFISALFIFLITYRKASRFSGKEIINLARSVVDNVKRTVLGDIKEGFRYLLREESSFFIMRSMFILFAGLGSIYTVIIVFIQENLGTRTQDLGILAVGFGLSLFLSSLVYGRFGSKFPVQRLIYIMLSLGGLSLGGFVWMVKVFPVLKIALPLAFLVGIFLGPIIVATTTLIHKNCQGELHGRIFSSLEVLIHFSFIIFMFLGSFLANVVGKARFITLVCAVFMVYGLGGLLKDAKDRRTQISST